MNSLNMKNIIIIISTGLVFLNLTIYLPFVKLWPLPAYTLDLFILITILWYNLKKRVQFPWGNPIIWWIIYDISLNFTYFLFSPAGEEQFLYIKFIFFLLIVLIYLILLFNLDNNQLSISRKTLVFLAPIATITLLIDYFSPAYFYYGKEIVNYVAGRASSLYLNANLAGTGMLIFFVFGIDMVSKKNRMWFILIIFLGLFFTMSRSNLMIFFLLFIIMIFQKKFFIKDISIFFIVVIIFFSWLGTGGLDYLADNYDLEVTDNMRNRVEFFSHHEAADTHDTDERKEVLTAALDMFMNKPLLGNGFLSTRLWEYNVSPHNTIAMTLADFGLFGLLLILLMLWVTTYNIFKYGQKEERQLAWLFIPFFLLSSSFSHNMLEMPFIVATIVLMATLGYKSKNNFFLEKSND